MFKKILVALDGSNYSRIAADYAFWLAANLGASVDGQHVVDPRLTDLFVSPQFAEALGFSRSMDVVDKVIGALQKIGKEILDLFAEDALSKGLKTSTILSEGYIVEELLKSSTSYDLVVVGHCGLGKTKTPSENMLGSTAERVAVGCKKPVLIAVNPLVEIKQILVAYDGSEPSIGSLLLAENLACKTGSTLKALTVIPALDQMADGQAIVEQGKMYLKEKWAHDIFDIKVGKTTGAILDEANLSSSLLVLGAYGFNDDNANVLGSTTSEIIRRIKTSVIVFKPIAKPVTLTSENIKSFIAT